MSQFIAMKVGSGEHVGAQQFQLTNKDFVKQTYGTQDAAVAKAKEMATLEPGQQFAVMGIVAIFETAKPVFIEKIVNDAGEIVLKPQEGAV